MSAEVHAKTVVVIGKVNGNVTAWSASRSRRRAREGDVRAPKLIVQEGAVLNGSIEMGNKAKQSQAERERAGLAQPAAPSNVYSGEKKALP